MATLRKCRKYRLRTRGAINYTNYALLSATLVLVLIAAHAKSAKLQDEHGQLSGMSVAVLDVNVPDEDGNGLTARLPERTQQATIKQERQQQQHKHQRQEHTNGHHQHQHQHQPHQHHREHHHEHHHEHQHEHQHQHVQHQQQLQEHHRRQHHQQHQQKEHRRQHGRQQLDKFTPQASTATATGTDTSIETDTAFDLNAGDSGAAASPITAQQQHSHRRSRRYHSKYTIEQLLHAKFEHKVSNDIDMDPCKAGGFMGDIALPEHEHERDYNDNNNNRDDEDDDDEDDDSIGDSMEPPIVAYTVEWQADATFPVDPKLHKDNTSFQLELEKLKQEVYHEGLQVEEEGMTDIIRKKTKLPSSGQPNQQRTHFDAGSEHLRNEAVLSANEPVKPTAYTKTDEYAQKQNYKNEVISDPDDRAQHQVPLSKSNNGGAEAHTESAAVAGGGAESTEPAIDLKANKSHVGFSNRNVDQRKIQSNNKDIEDDSGKNFVAERRVRILPTSLPPQRTTLPNVFSNAGGNGMPKFDDVVFLHAEGVVRRRHRSGRKHRRSSDNIADYATKLQRLRDELNPPEHISGQQQHHHHQQQQQQQQPQHHHQHHNQHNVGHDPTMTAHHNHHQSPPHPEAHSHHHRRHKSAHPPIEDALENEMREQQHKSMPQPNFNYSSENIDELEVLTKRKTTMDAMNDELHASLEVDLRNAENLKQLEHHHRVARAVTAKKERVWDYGVIPYEIDGNFTGVNKALFKQAMRHWENSTCIKFVERDPEIHPNYIVFTVRSCGCCSFVGKRGNGPQAISIGRNCDKFGIVVHELGHVVGFWHEHTRPDREKHVVIEHNNIMKGQDYNFNMLSPEEVDSLGMAYDYDSIMHYARNTFSKGTYLDTILPIEVKGRRRPEIGQRLRLSLGDIAQANLLYRCPRCGRTFQEGSGIFASPSYYTAGALTNETEHCEWRITATHGERVVLQLENLNILKSNNCQTDYLEVRDGYYYKSPLMGRFCGKVNNETLTTQSSRMLLTYVNTHRSEGYRGFKAEFDVVCGGELSVDETEGRLESPNYPLEYQANKECVWKITVPKSYQVALKFHSFEVENHDSCVYDYVEVRDGATKEAPLIGVFCGYKPPPNMKSSGNSMYVKFVSDTSVQKAGFSAIFMKEVDECETQNHGCEHECINTLGGYECSCHIGFELHSDKKHCEAACGGVIDYPNGTITSPSFPDMYPVLKECIWEIVAHPTYKISLNFTHFDLEGTAHQQSDCSYDSVTVYSKLSENRLKRIDSYCGSSIPPTVTSESNTLRIEFRSDKSIQRTGFAAVFFSDIDECAVKNGGCQHECRNTIGSYVCYCHNGYSLHENGHDCKEGECKFEISSPFGTIYSPNYPDSYPPNADCVWHFSTTPGHRIKLIFNHFRVESHQECLYDNIVIYDGESEASSTLGRFCGEKMPYPISSSTNQLYMVLQTDKNKEWNGFTAMHSTSCGGYLRATNQIQQFYSHALFGNQKYDDNMDCEWTIQAPPNNNVQLTFLNFEIEPSDNCSFDYVQVFSGMEDTSGPMYGQFCGNALPQDIISLTDSLLVRFKTDSTVSSKGFSASYVAIAPFDYSDEVEGNSYEAATPFPGSMKSIYKDYTDENSEDFSDSRENFLVNNNQYRSRNTYPSSYY